MQLGCFRFFTITNTATIKNVVIYSLACLCDVSLKQISENGIAGSKSRYIWNVDRCHRNAIQTRLCQPVLLPAAWDWEHLFVIFASLVVKHGIQHCHCDMNFFNHEWALVPYHIFATHLYYHFFNLSSFYGWIFF